MHDLAEHQQGMIKENESLHTGKPLEGQKLLLQHVHIDCILQFMLKWRGASAASGKKSKSLEVAHV